MADFFLADKAKLSKKLKMKKFMHDFKVVRNDIINPDYFVLYLQCSEPLPSIEPGQFAEVLVTGSPTTYLRRPFSIYDVDYENRVVSILIKSVGDGTKTLLSLSEGDTVNMIYPLGRPFSDPEGSDALLIGGGVGIAPMLLLAKSLHSKGCNVDVLIGGRTERDIIESWVYEPFARVFISTDDGSRGEKGLVTQHSIFHNKELNYNKIYACGPNPMMKAVASLAYSRNVPCEVSLENLMACGIGACLCCIVETHEGNKTTCVEGPVFDSRELAGWH